MAKPKRPTKPKFTRVEYLTAVLKSKFRHFGEDAPVEGNPIAHMMQGKPAEFTAGIPIRDVVKVMLKHTDVLHRRKLRRRSASA